MELCEGENDSDTNSRVDLNHEDINSNETNSLSELMEDISDIPHIHHSLIIQDSTSNNNFTKVDHNIIGLKRSASISVLNSSGANGDLDVEEHRFFVKLKSSSKEIRNMMWVMHERRQMKEAEEEMMMCKQHRKAALKSAREAVESVQNELAKTTSLTVLRGRLQEAEANNKELKQSIFYKMSDRSLVRLSAQPDLPRLLWQIVSLQSQVTVLRERVRHMSEKFQNMSPVPLTNKNDQVAIDIIEGINSTSTVTLLEKPKSTLHKPRSGWKTMIARFFGTKKVKE